MDGNSNSINEHYMNTMYWFDFIRENQPDQLAPNTSVGNIQYGKNSGISLKLRIYAVPGFLCNFRENSQQHP
jgi:hypothetical protein